MLIKMFCFIKNSFSNYTTDINCRTLSLLSKIERLKAYLKVPDMSELGREPKTNIPMFYHPFASYAPHLELATNKFLFPVLISDLLCIFIPR